MAMLPSLGLSSAARPGVVGKEGSPMSRIDSSLWEVLNVKSLGHRRGNDPNKNYGYWRLLEIGIDKIKKNIGKMMINRWILGTRTIFSDKADCECLLNSFESLRKKNQIIQTKVQSTGWLMAYATSRSSLVRFWLALHAWNSTRTVICLSILKDVC